MLEILGVLNATDYIARFRIKVNSIRSKINCNWIYRNSVARVRLLLKKKPLSLKVPFRLHMTNEFMSVY